MILALLTQLVTGHRDRNRRSKASAAQALSNSTPTQGAWTVSHAEVLTSDCGKAFWQTFLAVVKGPSGQVHVMNVRLHHVEAMMTWNARRRWRWDTDQTRICKRWTHVVTSVSRHTSAGSTCYFTVVVTDSPPPKLGVGPTKPSQGKDREPPNKRPPKRKLIEPY